MRGLFMRSIFRSSFRGALFGFMSAALLVSSASAADNGSVVPDLTGPWGRNMFNLEPPESGPGPLVNLNRLGKNAGRSVVDGDPIPLVGDYKSPILKPDAAAV